MFEDEKFEDERSSLAFLAAMIYFNIVSATMLVLVILSLYFHMGIPWIAVIVTLAVIGLALLIVFEIKVFSAD